MEYRKLSETQVAMDFQLYENLEESEINKNISNAVNFYTDSKNIKEIYHNVLKKTDLLNNCNGVSIAIKLEHEKQRIYIGKIKFIKYIDLLKKDSDFDDLCFIKNKEIKNILHIEIKQIRAKHRFIPLVITAVFTFIDKKRFKKIKNITKIFDL